MHTPCNAHPIEWTPHGIAHALRHVQEMPCITRHAMQDMPCITRTQTRHRHTHIGGTRHAERHKGIRHKETQTRKRSACDKVSGATQRHATARHKMQVTNNIRGKSQRHKRHKMQVLVTNAMAAMRERPRLKGSRQDSKAQETRSEAELDELHRDTRYKRTRCW